MKNIDFTDFFNVFLSGATIGEPIFRILLFFRELAEELFFLLLKLSYLLPAEGVH